MKEIFEKFEKGIEFLKTKANKDESICSFEVTGKNSNNPTAIYGVISPNKINTFSCLLVPQQWYTSDNKVSPVNENNFSEDKPFFGNDNWQEFWRICKTNFPLHSIWGKSGGTPDSIIRGEKEYTFGKLMSYLPSNFHMENKKVLEIGYGFGGTGLACIECGGDYFGIDYVASDKNLLEKKYNNKQRFFEINKSGIPDFLLNQKYDLIFSLNVMQHLTQTQRKEYFTQVSQCIKDDGIFVFDCFEWNEKYMGNKIRKDYNTKFFGVVTKIETKRQMKSLLKKCGLKIDKKFNNDKDSSGNVIKFETINPAYVTSKLMSMTHD